MQKLKKHQLWFVLLFFMAISLFTIMPYLCANHIVIQSWDLQFHLSRIHEITLQMREHGLLGMFPDINTKTFGRYGYPVNIFYPIYLVIPAAILGLFFNTYIVYLICLVLINFFLLLSMYLVANKIFQNKKAALLTSLFYDFGQYRFFNVIYRHDIGESLTMIFLPIVFYGIYLIILRNYHEWWVLTLGLTGVVFSNIPGLFITLFMILITTPVIFMHKENYKTRIKRFCYLIIAGITAVLLSAIFIIPFLWVKVTTGSMVIQVFNDLTLNTVIIRRMFFGLVPNLVDGLHSGSGLGIFALLCLVLIILKWKKLSRTWQYFSLEFILMLIFVTKIFPWKIFNHTFLDQLIQFPFRFALIPALLFPLILGEMYIILSDKLNYKWIVSCVTIIGMIIMAFQNCYIIKNPASGGGQNGNLITFSQVEIESLSKDYLPMKVGNDFDYLPTNSIAKTNSKMNLKQTKFKTGYNEMVYTVVASENYNNVVLPNVYYDGYRISNGNDSQFGVNKHGLITIKIHKGVNTIRVYYQKTKLQIISMFISLSTLIGLLIIIYRKKVKNEKEK